jgi:putative hemolysin
MDIDDAPGSIGTARQEPQRSATLGRSRREQPTLQVVWARHADEVADAQRLRYQVFAEEMGAKLAPPPGTPPGLDVDRFDPHCEHLLIRTLPTNDASARVVGTYRVLSPQGARLAGGLYSDEEFDLAPVADLRPRMVELGRSCIAPDYRTGGVILVLWSSLAQFMVRNELRFMIGCASIPMHDGGRVAASLWRQLRQDYLGPPQWHVAPRLPLPVERLPDDLRAELPPLIRGYLRCGARLLGAPAWDPDFGTADLPVMLDLETLSPIYRRHFMG